MGCSKVELVVVWRGVVFDERNDCYEAMHIRNVKLKLLLVSSVI